MDVNQTIVNLLEQTGVDHVFGGSGQVNASMLLALAKTDRIRTIIVNNEQAASFMAAGYAMFSNRLGVCFATGGPGAFNLFSGLAVAYSDSLPVLAITGYTSAAMRGKGALNESTGLSRTPDSHAMFAATTKKSYILEDASRLIEVVEDAVSTAFEGRPGPVHIHVPKDVAAAQAPPPRPIDLRIPQVKASKEEAAAFAEAFAARLPGGGVMLLAGYGCIRGGARGALTRLVDTYRIPFATTMDAKGYIDENHPLSLGVVGSSGDPGANEYFSRAKTILAVGNSFAENATFSFRRDWLSGKTLFHINIDRGELHKVYPADFALASDAKAGIEYLLSVLEEKKIKPLNPRFCRKKWHDEILPDYSRGKLHPGKVAQMISACLPENAIVLGDAGSHMIWLNCYLSLEKNQRYQNPGSFGPMASHVNGAIGVKCANPGRAVVAACGDGGYLMGGFELLTCVKHRIPVVYVIFNNGEYNVIKNFLLKHYKETAFMDIRNPDYVKYAKACGAKGFRAETPEEFQAAFCAALALGKPAIIDAAVDGQVYPPLSISKI